MAIIDKIQLSGTVYTIGNETTTAVTSASTDNEIPTAANIINNVEVNNPVINQVDATTIVKPSEEEKQNLQNILSKLGL